MTQPLKLRYGGAAWKDKSVVYSTYKQVEVPTCDYTPAKYLTLLFTDLGVLTPAAVSDELIQRFP